MGTEYKIFDDKKGGTLSLYEMSNAFFLLANGQHTTFEFEKTLTIADIKQLILELVRIWSYFTLDDLNKIAESLGKDIRTLY